LQEKEKKGFNYETSGIESGGEKMVQKKGKTHGKFKGLSRSREN